MNVWGISMQEQNSITHKRHYSNLQYGLSGIGRTLGPYRQKCTVARPQWSYSCGYGLSYGRLYD